MSVRHEESPGLPGGDLLAVVASTPDIAIGSLVRPPASIRAESCSPRKARHLPVVAQQKIAMNPEPEARHAWRFYRAGLGLRRADETVADLRGQHQAGVGRSPVHQLRGWLCQHPRDFLPRDRQSRGLLFRPGQLLDPAAQPVRLSPESSLPALEFLDQRACPRPPSPANAGRRPSRRSAGHPVKPLARTPFRRAAPKSFCGCSGAETKSGPGRRAQVGQGPGPPTACCAETEE